MNTESNTEMNTEMNNTEVTTKMSKEMTTKMTKEMTKEMTTERMTEMTTIQSVGECRDLATGELYQVGETWSNNLTCWQHSCTVLEGNLYYTTTTCPQFYVPPGWTNCSQVRGPGLSFPHCCPRPSCQTEDNN